MSPLSFFSFDRRLMRYIAPHRRTIVFGVFCAAVGSILNTAPVWLVKFFVNTILEKKASACSTGWPGWWCS